MAGFLEGFIFFAVSVDVSNALILTVINIHTCGNCTFESFRQQSGIRLCISICILLIIELLAHHHSLK